MDFSITEDQNEYRRLLIDFVRKEINCKEISFEKKWNLCAQYGLFGIPFKEEYGGLNESYITTAILMEALGYACNDNGFVFAIMNHLWACMNTIYQHGNADLKDKYIRKMISGEKIGALAITESMSGSNIADIKTTAVPVKEGYIINGGKIYVSNATIADVFLISARTSEMGRLNALTCFVCDKDSSGLIVSKEIKKMGLSGCPMAEIRFEKCFVPSENVLGRLGNGLNIINSTMDWERCFEFASHIGVMKRLLKESVTFMNERGLTMYQAVTHKVAQLRVNIEMAELLLYKIAYKKDKHKNTYLESSMFKYFISEMYVKACLDTLQIFGAYGYSVESNIEKEVRDALASKIYSGTTEVQLNIIYKLVNNMVMTTKEMD